MQKRYLLRVVMPQKSLAPKVRSGVFSILPSSPATLSASGGLRSAVLRPNLLSSDFPTESLGCGSKIDGEVNLGGRPKKDMLKKMIAAPLGAGELGREVSHKQTASHCIGY